MRCLMQIASSDGHTVTGSDILHNGHNAQNVHGADMLIYTTAAGADNCEILKATQLGIPVLERAQYLGTVSRNYKNVIAVSGSHGKTTTTAILYEIFKAKKPTVHLGGDYSALPSPVGGKQFFIAEACEYKRGFLHLNPSLCVVLNSELDHTDYYRSEEDIFDAFRTFCAQSESAVVFGDDPRLAALAQKNGYITFGFSHGLDYTAKNIVLQSGGGYAFDIFAQGDFLTHAAIRVQGRHNILNALAAAAAAGVYGIPPKKIAEGIAAYSGVNRRNEFLGEVNGARIFSDYAHHPTELAALVSGAREAGIERLIIVFQPHTYSRTKNMAEQFAQSLSQADAVYLTPVYAAREKPQRGVTSASILKKIPHGKARYYTSFSKLSKHLSGIIKKNDTVIFTGAGTVDLLARKFTATAFP